MVLVSSEKAHLAAVVAFLESAGASPMTSQEIDEARSLPAYYTEVHVMRRSPQGPRRNGSVSDLTQWRILTRAVAERYGNAQEMRSRAFALHGATLTVDGIDYYPESSVSDNPIAPDDGWWSGASEFTY